MNKAGGITIPYFNIYHGKDKIQDGKVDKNTMPASFQKHIKITIKLQNNQPGKLSEVLVKQKSCNWGYKEVKSRLVEGTEM